MSVKPRFYDNLLSGLFGDSKRPEAERPDLAVPMLAHWLPYRSYDPKHLLQLRLARIRDRGLAARRGG